ncbi:MAG: MtnX-like HAD-IB family phosphatase [Candidatus Latescibacteria bacterium]|nr:MtnX-like HAD-IB family phosphatase [Candidatus Latescibacterota bacterium]NIM66459.1 MtnX-like HAD-IB family phosphatase [Candidatus Latescibacterota bacterium]NIO02939.1 MtnX-like HAD-IB family phosphatase [Candidatus Latescibacterota bacterium]NIO30074.1 MtnX-like HAD-IB family phosphatase [Candidatus Latescibacterota bacterium]NIO57689.1 MtnX-like HAD-IB family phosphatase [Candidatus Latescibacterota bacterium]
MRDIAILCDFDGTVAREDVGHLLFRKFSEPNGTTEVVSKWKRGEISSKECLEREAELARVSQEELDEFILLRKLDPYFKDFLDFALKRGMEVAIVSDGLDYYIEKMLLRSGAAHVDFYANCLSLTNHSLKLSFPFYDLLECTSCANCKTYHLEQYREKGFYIVYVGNGLSDKCPCQSADLVFAKGDLLEFCRENEIQHIAFSNFRDVEREVLKRLVIDDDFSSSRDSRI